MINFFKVFHETDVEIVMLHSCDRRFIYLTNDQNSIL